TTPLPDTAVSVPPVQVVDALAGVATSSPAGRLSLKSSEVAASALALLSTRKLSVLLRPMAAGFGAKVLLNSGAATTVSVSLATPAMPMFDIRLPLLLA